MSRTEQIRARLGRRGAILALFGLAWVLQGLAAFLLGGPDSGSGLIHEEIPDGLRGTLWVATGIASVGLAFRRRKNDDTTGFLAITAMPMFLGTSYLVGAVTSFLPGGEPPEDVATLGVLGFLIYGVLTVALALIASWPEPPKTGGRSER